MALVFRARVAVVLLVSATGLARVAAAAPTPEDVDEARRHYARGVELYKQGMDAGALAELERAYALAPNAKVLYNIGLVELQLRDFAGALRAFERCLASMREAGADMTQARRGEVEAHVAKLREQVARATIAVDVDGAELTLDGAALGTFPLGEPVLMNPGRHRIDATAAAHEPASKVVSVVGGDRIDVKLELRRIPSDADVAPPPVVDAPSAPTPTPIAASPAVDERERQLAGTPPAPGADRRAPPLWVGWTTTGVLATAAVVLGIAAVGTNRALASAKADAPRSADDLDALAGRATGFAIAADVLGGAALVAGGVTLYVALRARLAPHAAPPAAGRARAELLIGPSRIGVRGEF